MRVPDKYTPAQKRIIHAYIEIMETHPQAGSSLYRVIADRLFYKIDQNHTNTYIRRVVRRYLQESPTHL